MIEPFLRSASHTFTAEPNPKAEWFFNEPCIATREYDGILMRNTTEHGWQFYTPFEVYTADDQTVLGHSNANWQDVYVKNGFFKQLLQSLKNEWRDRQSNFSYVQEFEDADSPFTEEYELGEYWLVRGESWYLVPVEQAEQLSNVNELELHKLNTPEDVFNILSDVLELLKDEIYGVIFTNSAGKKVRVRPGDFHYETK